MTLFLALLLALVVSALMLALLLSLAQRTGLMVHPGERRRIHREAVPRVGGLAIFGGYLAALFRWPDWYRRRLRLLRQAAPKAGA